MTGKQTSPGWTLVHVASGLLESVSDTGYYSETKEHLGKVKNCSLCEISESDREKTSLISLETSEKNFHSYLCVIIYQIERCEFHNLG